MTKYEKEHKTFTNLVAHYEKEGASAYLWSEIFLGWETKDLRALLKEIQAKADDIVCELNQLITLVEERRLR